MAASSATAKTYTITLRGDVADAAEARARRDNRTMSELVGEALRSYSDDNPFSSFDDIREYAATRNPHGYTEEEIPRLIREVREEIGAESRAKSAVTTQK